MNFEDIDVLGQPLLGGALQIARRGLAGILQSGLVEARVTPVRLVHREDVRLSPETADTLDAAHEARNPGRFDPPQFLSRRTAGQQPPNLLVHRLLHFGQVSTGTRRGDDLKLSADFIGPAKAETSVAIWSS